jgi:hypothetical protein
MRRAMPDIRGNAKKTDWKSCPQPVTKAELAALQYRRTNKIIPRSFIVGRKNPKLIGRAFILLNCSNRIRLRRSDPNQDNAHPREQPTDADQNQGGSTWINMPSRALLCFALSVF